MAETRVILVDNFEFQFFCSDMCAEHEIDANPGPWFSPVGRDESGMAEANDRCHWCKEGLPVEQPPTKKGD